MLHLAHKVAGAEVRGTDGAIGKLEDFYFDDDRWTVRYLLVGAGTWFSGTHVLISPMSVRGAWGRGGIDLSLARDQVRKSPDVGDLRTLSRESESRVLTHYGYPAYWGATGIWGSYASPMELLADQPPVTPAAAGAERTAPATRRLRSLKESTGFHIHASDGEIGHVDDFLIDQDSWRLRYLLVDTSNWIGGRSVIVSVDALQQVDPGHSQLHVTATRSEILQAPPLESIESALALSEIGPPFTII